MKPLIISNQQRSQLFQWTDIGMTIGILFFAQPNQSSFLIGILPLISGMLLRLWILAQNPLGSNSISGPHRLMRYPESLSTFLILFGMAFIARSFPFVLLSMVLVGLQIYLKIYSADLSSMKNDPKYEVLIPTLFPTLIPYPGGERESVFSWRQIFQRHSHVQVQFLILTFLGVSWMGILSVEPLLMTYRWVLPALCCLYLGIKIIVEKRF